MLACLTSLLPLECATSQITDGEGKIGILCANFSESRFPCRRQFPFPVNYFAFLRIPHHPESNRGSRKYSSRPWQFAAVISSHMEEEQSMHRLRNLTEKALSLWANGWSLEELCEILETLYKLRVLCDQCDRLIRWLKRFRRDETKLYTVFAWILAARW